MVVALMLVDKIVALTLICMHGYYDKMGTKRGSDWKLLETAEEAANVLTSWLQWSFSPTLKDISECASNPCQNGGTCVEGVNQYKCTCPQNWSGSHCQHQTQTGQYHNIHVWHALLCLCLRTNTVHVYSGISQSLMFIFPPLMQHHLSGVLWMTQHLAGDLAVPKWTKPNTAAVMRAFTWVAPLTTVSVRVSCSYVLLNWSLWGNSLFAASPNREPRSVTERFPRAGALLNDISAGQIANVLPKRTQNAWIIYFFSD